MATTKTIQPTGQTITIPALPDAPDASVFSDGIGKITDAVNSLNSKITIGTFTTTLPFETGKYMCMTADYAINGVSIPQFTIFDCHVRNQDGMAYATHVVSGRSFCVSGTVGVWNKCFEIASIGNTAVTVDAVGSYNTDVISAGTIRVHRVGRIVIVSLDFTTSQVIAPNTELVSGLPEAAAMVWLTVAGYSDNKAYRLRVVGTGIKAYNTSNIPAQSYNGFVVYVAKTL